MRLKKIKLLKYVENCFEGQTRKFTKFPYFYHLFNVSQLSSLYEIHLGFEIGLLHDIYEDTDVKPHECIENLVKFGYDKYDSLLISDSVLSLTKKYTGEKWKSYDEIVLAELETLRIKDAGDISENIKLCDIIDNIRYNIPMDKIYKNKKFALFIKKYLPQKKLQIEMLDNTDKDLKNLATKYINENYEYFNL